MMHPIHSMTKRLVEERKISKISMMELAERTRYSQSFLVKVACGHRTLSVNVLFAWADAFGYDVILFPKQRRAAK